MVLTTTKIDSISPSGGGPGVSVTINGTDFGAATGTVAFDPQGENLPAAITLWTPTQVVCTVPALVKENLFVDVLLTNQLGTDQASRKFWVPSSTPAVGTFPPGLSYQLPGLEENTPGQDTDDPKTMTAADFNRLMDRSLALGGGDMLKATYDANDDDVVDVAAALDDGGTPRTWADIVALVAAGSAGVDPKDACRVGTTADVGATYNNVGGASARGQFTWGAGLGPTTIDGAVLADGDRILVKDQGNPEENGIWVRTGQDVWDRADDFDSDAEVTQGAYTITVQGTVNAARAFVVSDADPITIGGVGGDPITWVMWSVPQAQAPLQILNPTPITATDTAELNERVLFNPTGGTFTINAPAGPTTGHKFGIKNVSADLTNITVDGNGANVENPLTSFALAATILVGGDGISLEWEYDGTQWLAL